METKQNQIINYFTRQGIMTEPGEFYSYFDALPDNLDCLVESLQGVATHIFWATRQGLELSEERQAEVQLRTVRQKLKRLLELNDAPLNMVRPPEQRLVCNCRDFTVLLTSILRHKGVPTRARAGFGTYFIPNHFEDHWVCETWDVAHNRWRMVDSQLDSTQREVLNIRFDPLDMPEGEFWTGGRAWLACRAGKADPDRFGIFDMKGLWFVLGDMIRDFLALNRVEILPWDPWPVYSKEFDLFSAEELEFFDHMAALADGGDSSFEERCTLFETHDLLRIPTGYQPGIFDLK